MAAEYFRPVPLVRKSRTKQTLVMSALLTKYSITMALQDMTSATVAIALINK